MCIVDCSQWSPPSFIKRFARLVCQISVAFSSSLSAETLLVGYGTHNAAPYTISESGELDSGIIKDIMDAVAEQLVDASVVYIKVPRKRMGQHLLSAKMHIKPIANPDWELNPEAYDWSVPLFKTHDMLVIPIDRNIELERIEDLAGMRLATILGYRYPELEEMISRGQLEREDTKTLVAGLKMLQLHRVDALINTDILIKYQLRSEPFNRHLKVVDVIFGTDDIRLMVSKQSPYKVEQLNDAIAHLKRSGLIQKILLKYQ